MQTISNSLRQSEHLLSFQEMWDCQKEGVLFTHRTQHFVKCASSSFFLPFFFWCSIKCEKSILSHLCEKYEAKPNNFAQDEDSKQGQMDNLAVFKRNRVLLLALWINLFFV